MMVTPGVFFSSSKSVGYPVFAKVVSANSFPLWRNENSEGGCSIASLMLRHVSGLSIRTSALWDQLVYRAS